MAKAIVWPPRRRHVHLGTLVAAIGLTLGIVNSAVAQEAVAESVVGRARPDHDPLGLVVGPLEAIGLELFPRAFVDLIHDDNIFRADSGQISDQIMSIQPQLEVRSNWDNHAVRMFVGGDIGRHRENPDEDYEDVSGAIGGRLDIREWERVSLNLGYDRKHEDRGSPDDIAASTPTIYYLGQSELLHEYDRDAILLRTNFRFRSFDYQDVDLINNDDRDRYEYRLTMRVGYEYVEGSTAFVEGGPAWFAYREAVDDNGFNRDGMGYDVRIGVTLDVSEVTFLEGAVGYVHRSFDDPLLQDGSGISARGSMVWNFSPLMTLTGTLTRDFEETTDPGASGILASRALLKLDYDPIENLILTAQAGYAKMGYDGITRKDEELRGGLGARLLIGHRYILGLTYDYLDYGSDAVGQDYTSNVVRLRLGLQL